MTTNYYSNDFESNAKLYHNSGDYEIKYLFWEVVCLYLRVPTSKFFKQVTLLSKTSSQTDSVSILSEISLADFFIVLFFSNS